VPDAPRPVRVTMVNKYYPPHLGGIEYVMRDMAEGLVAHEGASVRVLVSNADRTRVSETVNGVQIERFPRLTEFSSTPIARGLGRAIAGEARRTPPADVLHLHFPYPWGEVSWYLQKPGLPTVLTYHSDIVRQETALALYRPLLDRILDRVDLIVAASPQMIEHSPFLAPRAEKCRLVTYGVPVERQLDTPATLERAAAIRAEHGGRKIVLFVGRLVYYKGSDVLVDAMASVDADLIFVGTGPLEPQLREAAGRHGIADRITFLPPQPDAELAALYHAADVFTLPSVARSEAFGLVQVEAMAAGTPVVSTTLTTGVPFVNQNGVTGLTVAPGDVAALSDALSRILGDDELRARLGAAARERALSEFTIPRMCAGYADVYREAIALHAARGEGSS